jgi:uncharacterized protein
MKEKKPTFGKKLTPVQRYLFIAAGTVSLGLGILGIPVPMLPTTPFLLLSAYCYARSSRRFYYWLINHKVLGKHIHNYWEHRGITRHVKAGAIFLLWISMILTGIFAMDSWWMRLLLLVVAIAVTIHIAAIKTINF